MGNEWPRVVIADVCELIVDCVNKTAPVVEGPTPFKMIRTPNVKNGVVNTDTCRFVEAETFEKWTRRASVKIGDVLLTREAPLGEVGIVTSGENLFLGQRLMQYRANPELLDSKFLLYSFLSHDLQHQFSMHEGSGSVVSHIRVGDCLKFELNLPPLSEQKRISQALGSIDQKIQLNRETNKTLEAMAQALFKSWFVDFDPVIDNALAAGNDIPEPLKARAAARKVALAGLPKAQRALFPSEFEETEAQGWVPKGWGVKPLYDLADFINGAAYKKFEPNSTRSGLPIIKIAELKSGVTGNTGFSNVEMPEKYLIRNNDILFSWSGNPDTSIDTFVWSLGDAWLNQHIFRVIPSADIRHSFMLGLLRHLKPVFTEIARDKQTTGLGHVTVKDLKALMVVVPPAELLEQSISLLEPIAEKSLGLINSSQKLEKLRDTLLPKLISGELRLSDAEKQAKASR